MQPCHTLQLQAERFNKTSCTRTQLGTSASNAFEVALLSANTGASLTAAIGLTRTDMVQILK